MRPLLNAGIEIDIFPIYPLNSSLWRYVPDILNENVLPRDKVHHISFGQILRCARKWPEGRLCTFLQDIGAISASALRYGVGPLGKSGYVFLKAWAWACLYPHAYDHVLAYWGNYAGTCAYIFHRLIGQETPFSIFLHAGIDLYQNQMHLREKLLYADNIITCSNFNRKFINDRFSDIFDLISNKIYVHYHGLDFGEFLYEPEARLPRRILAVGSLEKYKGFDYLLRTVHELGIRGIDYEVELVGDGQESDHLKALAKKLQISDKVKFRGWLHHKEVQRAIRQATILVHPSPELNDGAPNVIKEAMALGTPVVASSVAAIPEMLENGRNGLLVPPKDVKALANSVETLLANARLRRKYADAAREYAEKNFDLWQGGRCLADLLYSTRRLERRKPA
jgi:glycosyltransferase involved in cell wall biosynthesis